MTKHFGAFVEVTEGVEGLVHISELSQKKIRHPSEVLNPGDQIMMKVIKINPKKEKISLSLKAYLEGEERQDIKKYMQEEPQNLTSLGDILNSALDKRTDKS